MRCKAIRTRWCAVTALGRSDESVRRTRFRLWPPESRLNPTLRFSQRSMRRWNRTQPRRVRIFVLMKRLVSRAAAAGALLLVFSPAIQASTNSDQVLARLISSNRGLRSFTANVNADVVMHSFPYLSANVSGVYYHKEPSRDKVVFT